MACDSEYRTRMKLEFVHIASYDYDYTKVAGLAGT